MGVCPCGHTGIFRCSSASCQRIGRNGKKAQYRTKLSPERRTVQRQRQTGSRYVNLKPGDDTADGTNGRDSSKTVEKHRSFLQLQRQNCRRMGKQLKKKHCCRYQQNRSGGSSRKNIWYSSAWMKKELETYRKKQQKNRLLGKSNRYRFFCGR